MAQQDSKHDGARTLAANGGRSRPVSAQRVVVVAFSLLCAVAAIAAGCSSGSSNITSTSTVTGYGTSGGSGTNTGTATGTNSGSGASSSQPAGYSVPQPACDAGLCQPSCNKSDTGPGTTITGKVYDPAGINPIPHVAVFVADPTVPLPNLKTIPSVCGCNLLYPADVLAAATTGVDGSFTIPKAPAGTGFTIVVQDGKWRRVFGPVTLDGCVNNDLGKITLPKNGSEGDLPEIAISTGGADSLECLLARIGVSKTEYTGGATGTGHIHIYQGWEGATTSPAAPASYQQLWASVTQLHAYDVVLLSCEGHETTGGSPTGVAMNQGFQKNLMDYANAGGRVFASHYHYKWFNDGPFSTAPNGPLAT